MTDGKFSQKNQVAGSTLDDLACRVRVCCEAIRKAGLTVLGHALDAGDCLNEAQSRVSTNWKNWLRENCFLAVSTAQLYQQLARHREEIEDEIVRFPELSLRAAVRLISKSKPNEASKSERPLLPEWLIAWNRATAEEKTAGLATIRVATFLQVIPTAWRAELERRIRGLETHVGDPNTKLTAAFRSAMSHLASADDPKASAPVVQSQQLAALNALRAIARLHPDFHDLAVGIRGVEKPRRRRAA